MLRAPPRAGHAKRGLILFCAEQGFAGAFSERVFEAAASDLAAGHEHGRRHARRSSRKRARNQARLVGGDDRRGSTGSRVSQTGSLRSCMATSPRAPSRRPISSSRARSPAAASASTGIRCCRSTSNALHGRIDGAGSADRARALSVARTPCGGIRLRTIVRSRHARIRRRERGADGRDDGRQDQHGNKARCTLAARAAASAGRNHDRDHRTCGRSRSFTKRRLNRNFPRG